MKSLIERCKDEIPFEVREYFGLILIIACLLLFNILLLFEWVPAWMLDFSEIINQVLSFCFLMMVILSLALSIDKQLKYSKGLLEDEVRINLIIEDEGENARLVLGISLFIILSVLLFFIEKSELPFLTLFENIINYLGFVFYVILGFFLIQYFLKKVLKMPKGYILISDDKLDMIGLQKDYLDVNSIESIKISKNQIIIESPKNYFYESEKLLLTEEKIREITDLMKSVDSIKNSIVNIDLA